MKIFGLGIPELLIILVVILLIFGPKNLPKLGSAIGRAVKGLRDGMGSNANKTEEPAEGVVEDVVVENVDQLDQANSAPAAAAVAAGTVGATAAAPKTVKRVVKKKTS